MFLVQRGCPSLSHSSVNRTDTGRSAYRVVGRQALDHRGRCASEFNKSLDYLNCEVAMTAPTRLDTAELARQVKALYRQVAQQPTAAFHFPLGRPLAERLGYPADLLDAVPAEALASFAGVGYAL